MGLAPAAAQVGNDNLDAAAPALGRAHSKLQTHERGDGVWVKCALRVFLFVFECTAILSSYRDWVDWCNMPSCVVLSSIVIYHCAIDGL